MTRQIKWSEYPGFFTYGTIPAANGFKQVEITVCGDGDVEIEVDTGWNQPSEKVTITVEQMREIVRKADEVRANDNSVYPQTER